MNRFLLILLVLASGNFAAWSQENHYWSQQFGAVSTLMGGAMIAGVRDNSAAFYNPGALSFIEHANLSVDANVYKMDKINLTDGAGSGINLNSAQVNIYPQIIAGMINYIKVPDLKFSYSILTRNFTNILMSERYSKPDASGSEPAQNRYLGDFDYVNQINEQWFGLCISYKTKSKIGIGITLFGTYRGQTAGYTHNSREIAATDSLESLFISNNTESIKFMAVGTLAKFGLAYETGRWRFGLSITSPSIGLYGNGSVRREESFYVFNPGSENKKSPYIIMAENTSATAKYLHPFAMGLGVEYNSPKTRIAVSGEYYSKINSYYIMKAGNDAFIYPSGITDSSGMSSKIEEFLYIGSAAKPVFNLGLGFDQSLGERFNLLVGAHTDYSSYTQAGDLNELLPKTGTWDLYYFSSGLSYHSAKQTMTIGFSYAFSPTMQTDPIVIVSPGSEMSSKAEVFAQSFGVVVGYTYYFVR